MKEHAERHVRSASKAQTDSDRFNSQLLGGRGTSLLTDPRYVRSDCQLIAQHLDVETADPELVETIMRRLKHHSLYGQTIRIRIRAFRTILALAEKALRAEQANVPGMRN